MILTSFFLLLVGLAVLLYGGDIFVKGAASTATIMKISPIVIGLTVVSFGTSAPELVVNLFSASQGASDLAIGNILGSNIANILLVLGISAMIRPLKVKPGTTWNEIPLGLLSVIVLFLLVNDSSLGDGSANLLSRGDGLVLLCFFMIFLVYIYGLSKVKGEKETVDTYSWFQSMVYMVFGVAGLVFGGKLIVDNATVIALSMGMSELFIGLTITALGTSLPELATSAIAAYRGHVDLAVGNVVGSNIFNILWILGITSIISPLSIDPAVNTDIIIAAGTAALLFGFMFTGGKFQRNSLRKWEGFSFILLYIVYIGYISFRG